MPSVSDLPYLIRLLDDNDPDVRPAVREQFATYDGDISHDLAALGVRLSPAGKKRVSQWLEPGRRQSLAGAWLVPSNGMAGIADDWDNFENLLGLLMDFLHDGITLRPSLHDSLDLLAEDIREQLAEVTADSLRRYLFVRGPFSRGSKKPDALKHFDLCYVIDRGVGNATSLGCLFMLLGRRLNVAIEACNYPGHFLCKMHDLGRACLVDCAHNGRRFDIEDLLGGSLNISDKARASIVMPCYLGDVLARYLLEMHYSLGSLGRSEDADLLKQLAASLK
ncbi:hypothetical protein HW115_03215 [Verrucomicrobiaceae bacterium N1E253]|uniref:Protein SirB1 N-terminal domain-containing protein n=1 Tax=Oceaniferula marina TaxID=2748318 RepID=A0A851GKB0_9BACT|nr:transglutaminase family protein [Oceaniferula marina]NWK54604.1 hypothetical protein [Oceaniferula marina]